MFKRLAFSCLWLGALIAPAFSQTHSHSFPATVDVEPFVAYYGQSGDLRVIGSGVDSPIALPHHIGCPQDTGVPVDKAVQNICGPGRTAYYNSIGQSGGNRCGYNVFAGVCVKP